jgi:hypothetical protein
MQLPEGWREAEAKRNEAVWWMHFSPSPLTGLLPKGYGERADVFAMLYGIGGSLPDGWQPMPANGGLQEVRLGGCGAEWVACHAGFVTGVMRAATRAAGHVPEGTLRRAGTEREYDMRDHEAWVPAVAATLQGNES